MLKIDKDKLSDFKGFFNQGFDVPKLILIISPRSVVIEAFTVHAKVSLGDDIRASGLRVVVSKSIAYKNAIFVEVFADYSEAPAAEALATWVSADFEAIMKLLALTEGEEKQ